MGGIDKDLIHLFIFKFHINNTCINKIVHFRLTTSIKQSIKNGNRFKKAAYEVCGQH